MVKFGKKLVVYLKERKAKIFSLLYARKGKIMALSNLENRVKQDSAYPRTAEDAIRRDKVTIKAKEIELEGYTTINGGFKIDNTGNMECNNATINGAIISNGSKFRVDAEGNMTCSGARMDNIGIYNGNGRFIVDSTGNLQCQQVTCTGQLTVQDQMTGVNNGIDVYGERDGIIKLANHARHRFMLSRDNIVVANFYIGDSNNSGNLSLRNSSGTETINGNGSTGVIKCVSLTQTSLEEAKKDFEKLDNALDLIKGIDIYKYNLKTEDNGDKKHIGFVIGDGYKYKREITDKQNKGVDLYSFVSLCCKAIQEQQEEIEELRKLVNK